MWVVMETPPLNKATKMSLGGRVRLSLDPPPPTELPFPNKELILVGVGLDQRNP